MANIAATICYVPCLNQRMLTTQQNWIIARTMLRNSTIQLAYFPKSDSGPVSGIGDWVTEHVEEDGLGKGVEEFERALALAAQRIRLVQNRRDPPLLL